MRRTAAILVLAVSLALGCSSNDESDETSSPSGAEVSTSTTAKPAEEDPYDVYLANNPDPELVLSREDAQARALLGCGQEWAPGTIDAVLAEAYGHLCP